MMILIRMMIYMYIFFWNNILSGVWNFRILSVAKLNGKNWISFEENLPTKISLKPHQQYIYVTMSVSQRVSCLAPTHLSHWEMKSKAAQCESLNGLWKVSKVSLRIIVLSSLLVWWLTCWLREQSSPTKPSLHLQPSCESVPSTFLIMIMLRIRIRITIIMIMMTLIIIMMICIKVLTLCSQLS